MAEYRSGCEEDTRRIARSLAGTLAPGAVVAFRGGLGAGKTAFVRGLAQGLGMDEGQVSSPTFALVHEYRGGEGPALYHFDMYRVTDMESLYTTGFFDYLDAGGILAVEWSENIAYALPKGTVTVDLQIAGETERRITITGGEAT